jgi:hypothetical protein
MRGMLLLLLLSVVLVLPGCSGGGSHTCSRNGLVPNATYLVTEFDVFSGPPAKMYTRVASPTGTITITTTANCSDVGFVLLTNSNIALSASPSSINLESPPATVTITGQSFDTTYSMPRVEYFDGNGFLVGSTLANSVWGGGTALECSVPDLSQVYSGTYTILVTNKTSQDYYAHRVGTATITTWGRDRLDSDGDGWYDDQDCDPYNPYVYTDCYCGGGQEPITVCP